MKTSERSVTVLGCLVVLSVTFVAGLFMMFGFNTNDHPARSQLLLRFEHRHPNIRQEVLNEIAKRDLWDEEALGLLNRGLDDSDKQIRVESALLIVEHYNDPARALARLADELTASHDVIAKTAILLRLGRLGIKGSAAAALITGFLADNASVVRASAAQALGQIGPRAEASVGALCRLSNDSDVQVRVSAVQSLGRIGSIDALPTLTRCLGDGADSVKLAAAQAIAAYGPRAHAALPRLLDSLSEPNTEVRGFVAQAIKYLQPAGERTRVRLQKALDDDDAWVRQFVAETLVTMELQDAETIEVLERMLASSDNVVVRIGIQRIGRMGPKAGCFIPQLLRLIKCVDPDVAAQAKNALAKLEPALK